MRDFNRTKMVNGKPTRTTDVRSNNGTVKISLTTKEPGRLMRGVTKTGDNKLFIDREWFPAWDDTEFVGFLNDHDMVIVEYSSSEVSSLYECAIGHGQYAASAYRRTHDDWVWEGILLPLN